MGVMHWADIDWLPILRRTVGAAAIVMALAVVAVWAGNFAITKEVVESLGPDAIINLLTTLGWIEIVAGAVVVLGLAAGQWFHRPLWAPGVLFVVLGMALHWGWWLLDRRVDLFGTSGFTWWALCSCCGGPAGQGRPTRRPMAAARAPTMTTTM